MYTFDDLIARLQLHFRNGRGRGCGGNQLDFENATSLRYDGDGHGANGPKIAFSSSRRFTR